MLLSSEKTSRNEQINPAFQTCKVVRLDRSFLIPVPDDRLLEAFETFDDATKLALIHDVSVNLTGVQPATLFSKTA